METWINSEKIKIKPSLVVLAMSHSLPDYVFSPKSVFRFISHFCAPGFSLLMGTGMVLLSQSRRLRAGWSSLKLLRFFLLRGFILIVLGFAVRTALLILLIDPNPKFKALAGHPAAAHLERNVFQVMTALGLQMIFTALVLEMLHTIERLCGLDRWRLPLGGSWPYMRFGFQPTALCILATVCIAISNVVVHRAQNGDPANTNPGVARSFSEVLVRFVLLPGNFYDENSRMLYPILPWLGMYVLVFG